MTAAGQIPAPPPEAPSPPWWTPAVQPPARPGGVTYACILSIVLGSFGILLALMVMAAGVIGAAFLGALAGATRVNLGAAELLLVGAVALAMAAWGVMGIVAGAQGLKGAAWARWTMVVLFGLGALFALGSFKLAFPLALVAANVVAIVMLVNGPATDWFAKVSP